MKYLNLIRWKNLVMMALAQCAVKFGLLLPFNVDITLSSLGFIFLVVSTLLIAAGGYVINDIYDIDADKINKPNKRIVDLHIPEKKAKAIYLGLTFTGVGMGFVLSNMMKQPSYFAIFVLTSFLLYLYSVYLKKIAFLGNLVISLLVGLSIYIVGIFELIPAIDAANRTNQLLILNVLLDYSIFAILINFIRELVKDIEDIQGDHVARYNTLPILLGGQRTARLASIFSAASLFVISWYTFTYLYDKKIVVAIMIFGIVGPLAYCAMRLWEAKSKKDYFIVSTLLKIALFIGICAIPTITFAIKNAVQTS